MGIHVPNGWIGGPEGSVSDFKKKIRAAKPVELLELLKTRNRYARIIIGESEGLGEEVQLTLCEDSDLWVRAALARNKSKLATQAVEKLLTDKNNQVRYVMANRRDLSEESLNRLANDKQYKARVRVAKNPDIGRDLAEKFTKDRSYTVRMTIAKSPLLGKSSVEKLLGDRRKPVIREAAKSKYFLIEELFKEAFIEKRPGDRAILEGIAMREDITLEIAFKLYEKYPGGTKYSICYFLATNPNLPEEIKRKLAKNDGYYVRRTLAKQKGLSFEACDLLLKAQEKNWFVNDVIYRKSGLPAEICGKPRSKKSWKVIFSGSKELREEVSKWPTFQGEGAVIHCKNQKDLMGVAGIFDNYWPTTSTVFDQMPMTCFMLWEPNKGWRLVKIEKGKIVSYEAELPANFNGYLSIQDKGAESFIATPLSFGDGLRHAVCSLLVPTAETPVDFSNLGTRFDSYSKGLFSIKTVVLHGFSLLALWENNGVLTGWTRIETMKDIDKLREIESTEFTDTGERFKVWFKWLEMYSREQLRIEIAL